MSNNKKYISLTRLSDFLDNIKTRYSQIGHTHKLNDLTDYTVDTSLSSTSTNPVQNKVIDAEFDAIADAMGALETAIDGKADEAHNHTIADVTNLQTTLDAKVPTSRTINGKALTSNVTLSAADVGAYTQDEVSQQIATVNTSISNIVTGMETVGKAEEATTAWCDGNGDNIAETYATNDALADKADATHTHDSDYGITTAGTGAAYTATVNGITSLTAGVSFIMIPHTVSTSTAPTLNVNSLGAKNIRRMVSNSSTSTAVGYNASWLGVNKPIRVTYNGTYWIAEITKPSAADMSGTLGVKNGGTGKTSVTAGNFLVGNGTSAMTEKTPAEVLTALGVTATAAELNYCDGATSNIQTQIDSLSSEIVNQIPTTLPNPNKLIFTGAVTGEYDGSEEVTINLPISADTEIETILSDNLFDKTIAVAGSNFYHSSSGPSIVTRETTFIAYVPLAGAGVYRFPVNENIHGASYACRIPLLKEDKTFIRNATATILDATDVYATIVEVTVTESDITNGAYYIAFDGWLARLDSIMIVKDRDYPDEYLPYGYIEIEVESGAGKQDNILYKKTALFLGTSICAGTTVGDDSEYYGYGWAGLIGEANNMTWKNYGRNGGTVVPIASVVAESRDLSSQLSIAMAAHDTADYVLFQGGGNDADQLGTDGLGTIASGYSNFDTTTFTGALESLILNIINAYPNAKIGYIIPQKMYVKTDYTATGHIHRVYFDRALEVCKKWGVPVVDLWNENPMNPALTVYYDSSLTADEARTNGKCYVDGQHLTLEGYQRITPQIEAFMRNL